MEETQTHKHKKRKEEHISVGIIVGHVREVTEGVQEKLILFPCEGWDGIAVPIIPRGGAKLLMG